ncbi:hypothetical protein B0T16DRAFT_73727 [Cercophora newfieldiana]|uniref:Uncharacterized protein n=1 Tax=Cercophora newfieldiana TaxID=92897 RepID=A0AA39YEG9_9PEZI|nr:hypothetical protein B0T16DRAFT_73727 [Cercophora newfieldiana]
MERPVLFSNLPTLDPWSLASPCLCHLPCRCSLQVVGAGHCPVGPSSRQIRAISTPFACRKGVHPGTAIATTGPFLPPTQHPSPQCFAPTLTTLLNLFAGRPHLGCQLCGHGDHGGPHDCWRRRRLRSTCRSRGEGDAQSWILKAEMVGRSARAPASDRKAVYCPCRAGRDQRLGRLQCLNNPWRDRNGGEFKDRDGRLPGHY